MLHFINIKTKIMKNIMLVSILLISSIFSGSSVNAMYYDKYEVSLSDSSVENKEVIKENLSDIKEALILIKENVNSNVTKTFIIMLQDIYWIEVKENILTTQEKRECEYFYFSTRGTKEERNKCAYEMKKVQEESIEYKRSIGLTY